MHQAAGNDQLSRTVKVCFSLPTANQCEAWWKVAEYYQMNGTGLSLEIAKELRDRQKKNAFAHNI
jgi:hypothetical protein